MLLPSPASIEIPPLKEKPCVLVKASFPKISAPPFRLALMELTGREKVLDDVPTASIEVPKNPLTVTCPADSSLCTPTTFVASSPVMVRTPLAKSL